MKNDGNKVVHTQLYREWCGQSLFLENVIPASRVQTEYKRTGRKLSYLKRCSEVTELQNMKLQPDAERRHKGKTKTKNEKKNVRQKN